MSDRTYRVIQWMTGDVGQVGVRHFAENSVFELVGVLVHSKDKVGMDAGEIAGIAPTGVIATDDVKAITAMDADCVFYTPIIMDVEQPWPVPVGYYNLGSPIGGVDIGI